MSYCQHCIDNPAVCTRMVLTMRGMRKHRLCAECAKSISPTTKKVNQDRIETGNHCSVGTIGRPLTQDEKERMSARVSLDHSSMLLTLDWIRPPR